MRFLNHWNLLGVLNQIEPTSIKSQTLNGLFHQIFLDLGRVLYTIFPVFPLNSEAPHVSVHGLCILRSQFSLLPKSCWRGFHTSVWGSSAWMGTLPGLGHGFDVKAGPTISMIYWCWDGNVPPHFKLEQHASPRRGFGWLGFAHRQRRTSLRFEPPNQCHSVLGEFCDLGVSINGGTPNLDVL